MIFDTSKTLNKLLLSTECITITDTDKIIIFSDLHLGDGSFRDDFLHNSVMFLDLLENYYLENDYLLVLNGDIEELQRYSFKKIEKQWSRFYDILAEFNKRKKLIKIIGNHDSMIRKYQSAKIGNSLSDSIKLYYKNNEIFILHGHQGSALFSIFNDLLGILLKIFANPLGVKNFTMPFDDYRKYKIEKNIYRFSIEQKNMTIIGHTHRPLFESMSKLDSINYKIEKLLRRHKKSSPERRIKIEKKISILKSELKEIFDGKNKIDSISSIYNNILIPSLFNSGCVIGKRGFTGIDISNGNISLIQWFYPESLNEKVDNKKISKNYNKKYYYRVIKSDNLDYIFTRIKLLA